MVQNELHRARKTPKRDLKVQSRFADDAAMSNLWKALRDVSRDVDPTIGFETLSHGSDTEGPSTPPVASPEPTSTPPSALERPMTANRPRPPAPSEPSV